MGSDTYTIRTTCENCGMDDQISIPHGTAGKDFFRNKECCYCKCVNCVKILPFVNR